MPRQSCFEWPSQQNQQHDGTGAFAIIARRGAQPGERWRRLRSLPAFRLPDQRVGIRSDFHCRHRSLPIQDAQRGIGLTFNWGSLQASECDALQREPRKCCGNAHMRGKYHGENRPCEHLASLPDY